MKNKMICGNIFARTLALVLVISIVGSVVHVPCAVGETVRAEDVSSYVYQSDTYISEMISNNYTQVSRKYSAPNYSGDSIPVCPADTLTGGTAVKTVAADYDGGVLSMKYGDTAVFQIEVAQTACYLLRFDYMSADDSILPMELGMMIDGAYPFYEARRIAFESTWVAPEEKAYDRYGREIVSIPNKLMQWETKYLTDASYRYSTPLLLELTKGSHEITLTVSEGSLYLGRLYLEAYEEVPTYTGSEKATGDGRVIIEAEDFTYRNDSAIRAIAEYDTDVAPYDADQTVLNTIDRDSFKSAGQTVTYDFFVEQGKAGYYKIALNYCQSQKSDFPVFVDVKIDNALPNTAFSSYPLAYTANYRFEKLTGSDGEYLSVYLSEGKHTISLTITIDNIRHILENVERIIYGINDLSLEIIKVAGTNKDKYRDLKLSRYIPDVTDRLYGWVDELYTLKDSVLIYNKKAKSIAAFASMKVVADMLKSLAKEPDEIPYRVSELSQSISSATQHLATTITNATANQLAIDTIVLYQDSAKLPKRPGIIKGAYLSIKRFVTSFTNEAYSLSNLNEEHLQVWVNRSRQYVEVMQKMIDEQFTPQTGIEVDLCVMTDMQKLILANASGDTPDIATGINYSQPFELAVRGALVDLTAFEDFKEVAGLYPTGLHIPATIGNSIYAMPETMNFWVLFYRTDIFEKLGLSVPDTVEEMQDLASELQIRGLNFYYPTAGMTGFRHFHGTTPLLFQNGAVLYRENMKTGLDSEEAVEALTTLTELFTIYNLPVDVPSFYQHFRSGDLPVGIADFATYNLLLNAAPEIANSWEVAPIPGTKKVNEDGSEEICRYISGGATSTVMFASDEEREAKAWEFMKWWSSTEVQTEYGQTVQISYGTEYIWNTANLEAIGKLPWDTKDKQVILEQAKWILEAPRVLGTYMMERQLSYTFDSIVVDGVNLRERLDDAVKVINRETERKLEEFGYTTDGTGGKVFEVPTLSSVKKILEIPE